MGEQNAAADGTEPYLLSMVVCDQIYSDPGTGKRSLLGMFSARSVREMPAKVAQMVLFCR